MPEYSLAVSSLRRLDVGLDGLHQAVLVGVLAVQRLDHHLVGTTLDDQPVNNDALGLALAVEPRFALGVKLQAPGQAVPDQVVTALLQVQSVGAAGGLGQQNVQLSCVPVCGILPGAQHGESEALVAALRVSVSCSSSKRKP